MHTTLYKMRKNEGLESLACEIFANGRIRKRFIAEREIPVAGGDKRIREYSLRSPVRTSVCVHRDGLLINTGSVRESVAYRPQFLHVLCM